MSKELKCCPFCGGEAEIRHSVLWYWIQCKICGVTSKDSANKDLVIEQWNTRKPIDRIVENVNNIDTSRNWNSSCKECIHQTTCKEIYHKEAKTKSNHLCSQVIKKLAIEIIRKDSME